MEGHVGEYVGSSSHSTVPPEVVKKTRAVLLSCTKGVLMKSFGKDFCKLAGEPFPWRRLGYTGMKSLLQAMPEAVHFEYSPKDGDYKLYGVGDCNSFYMPSWQQKTQERIKVQRRCSSPVTPVRSRGRSCSPRISSSNAERCSHGDNDVGLTYNLRGLVTLYVKWRGRCAPTSRTAMNEIIHDYFSTIEEPAEVFVDSKPDTPSQGIAFVRYDDTAKARQVMQQLNSSTHQGFSFNISAARNRIEGQKLTNDHHVRNGPIRTQTSHSQVNESSRVSLDNENSRIYKPALNVQTLEMQFHHNRAPKSCDDHMTVKEENIICVSQVQNRFRGLINDLDPGDNRSDSDDSSIVDFLEWEQVLDSVPSMSQLVSHTSTHGPSDLRTKCWKESCDESHDRARPGPRPRFDGEIDCHNSPMNSSSESHDQPWDVAPLLLSDPSPPNDFGLIQVHVSEVVTPELVWLQLSSDIEGDLKCISAAIANHQLKPLNQVCVGDYCCIRHSLTHTYQSSEENVTYKRALVESTKYSPIRVLRQATLSLIDSGTEKKAFPMDDLLELPSMVHPSVVPPLAAPCSLHGIVCINEEEGWFPLDIQLLWKHLYHNQVYAKEIVVPKATDSIAPLKRKAIPVELYFDPRGLVSIVDVLVQEGMRMDYAQPQFPFEESRSLDGGGVCERDQTANKTVKNVLDLPTVPESTLESENDGHFDSEDIQYDLDSLLIEPYTSGSSVHTAPAMTDSCGGNGGIVGHETSSKFLLGQKIIHSSYQSVVANQILTQFSSWQGFLEFCDNFL